MLGFYYKLPRFTPNSGILLKASTFPSNLRDFTTSSHVSLQTPGFYNKLPRFTPNSGILLQAPTFHSKLRDFTTSSHVSLQTPGFYNKLPRLTSNSGILLQAPVIHSQRFTLHLKPSSFYLISILQLLFLAF